MWKFIWSVYAGLSGYKWGWRRNRRQILILPLTFMPSRWGNKEGWLSKDAKKENTGVKDSHTFIYTPVHAPPFSGQDSVCWRSGFSDTEVWVRWGPVTCAPHFPLDIKLWRPKGFKLLSTSVSLLEITVICHCLFMKGTADIEVWPNLQRICVCF